MGSPGIAVMELHYISPSLLPSLSANSVHVVRQVRALADAGANVTLYACRAVRREGDLPGAIEQQYGVSMRGVRLVTRFGSTHAAGPRITAFAAPRVLAANRPFIISRNLYAAFVLGVLARQPLVYEIHDVETGFRGRLQRAVLQAKSTRVVVISARLGEFLAQAHGAARNPLRILHDAAPGDIVPVPADERRARLAAAVPEATKRWRGVCGYVGHLYPGRGVEVIEAMARELGDVLFVVVGGTEADVAGARARNSSGNLVFTGHRPHRSALELACCTDVLLMPYQPVVSIGVAGRDTARWMSPMKMFEYMASGVPIVSSDLPVLREVLRDGDNALLAPPGEATVWSAIVRRLLDDPALRTHLARRARTQFLAHHTWEQRARALMNT
jgi:glycosyltransferase involved in cell wall biosynthesis